MRMAEDDTLFAGVGDGTGSEGLDAAEAEAIVQAFGELRAGLAAVQADLAERLVALEARTVGGAQSSIEGDYAGEMARLCDLVRSLDARLEGLEGHLDKGGTLEQTLKARCDEVQSAVSASRRSVEDARTLAGQLGSLIAGRRDRGEQNDALLRRLISGFLAGAVLIICFYWTLPDMWQARRIMGEASYWDAGWRMLDKANKVHAGDLRTLDWIEWRNGHRAQFESCQRQARETGKFVRCRLLFRPDGAGKMTPPPP